MKKIINMINSRDYKKSRICKILNMDIRTLNKLTSMNAIGRELKISRKTVTNYLNPNFSVVHGHYGVKKKGLLIPYFNEINTYINANN